MIVIDPTILLIALSAFFIGGILKGAMGFGLPMLAIPALTTVHSLPMALSITVLPVVATNIWQIWAFRKYANWDFLVKFLATGAFGLVAGAALLSIVRDAYLEIGLGLLVLAYLATRLRRPARASTRVAPAVGFVAGAMHGATGLSGLVGTPYFHALQLERPAFIFCNTAMFTLFSLMHLPTLAVLGLYRVDAVWVGLMTLPVAFLGLWLGERISSRLTSKSFSRLVITLLTFAAIMPIWNGIRDLLAG